MSNVAPSASPIATIDHGYHASAIRHARAARFDLARQCARSIASATLSLRALREVKQLEQELACLASEFEAEVLPPRGLDIGVRVRFEEVDAGLEHVALVSCAEHYEGRDWTVEVIRTLRDGQVVRTAGDVAGRIADWCERERFGVAKAVWEACRGA